MRRLISITHRSIHFITRNNSSLHNKSYSETLLLPKTTFPLRQSNSEETVNQLHLRTTKKLWDWQSKQRDRPTWTILDGPPYANGSIHIGHALNKILKDIINRNKILNGFRINYVPGFDCHGLPLELKAIDEIQPNLSPIESLNPIQVRDAAREIALKGVQLQTKEFDKLSILTDWNNSWRTLDPDYEIKQLELFGQMVKNRLITQYRKPVYFSPSSKTALAEAEIEYRQDHLSRSVYVAFDLVKLSPTLQSITNKFGLSNKLKIIIWTTTPWTLVANQAVVIHKDMQYSIVKVSLNGTGDDEVMIFATHRLSALRDLLSDMSTKFDIIAELSGEQLISTTYTHDFTSSELPIFPSEHVTFGSGSGLVHTAPSHGLEDFRAYTHFMMTERHSQTISYIDLVDNEGRFNSGNELEWKKRLHGKAVLDEGNEEVIRMLKEQNRLIGKEINLRHKYPYDWRTKKPILTKITSQWFIELESIRNKALSILERVEFHPPPSRNRLESFLRSRSEWCISRQRPWGVPIPVLYSYDTGLPLLTCESVNWIIGVLKSRGTEYWWKGPVEDFIPPGISGKYKKGSDVMDVWFDSGVSWLTLGGAQADVVLEGSDQHRGWFQSLLLTSISSAQDLSPKDPVYQLIITHGFTLDKHGRKMSKSSGNILSPLELISGNEATKQPAFGIDVLRFWTASVDFTKDVTISVDQLSHLSNAVRKIRSTVRFLIGNVYRDEKIAFDGLNFSNNLGLIERYMLHCLYKFQKAVQLAYNELDFNQVVQLVMQFTIKTLSAFYFETVKDILYSNSKDDLERQQALYLMSQVLRIYKLAIAPIVPHLAEEIDIHQRSLPMTCESDRISVFEETWPPLCEDWTNPKTVIQMEFLLSIRDLILQQSEVLRQDKKFRTMEELELVIDVSDLISKSELELTNSLLQHDTTLPRLFGLSDVSICKSVNVTNTVLSIATPAWKHPFEFKFVDSQDLIIKLILIPAWRSKCPRCWKYTLEQGVQICTRCSEAITKQPQ